MKKLVLMAGGQGSGKGTMAQKILKDNPNFKYVETGAMLRALPDNSPLKQIMARGEFVPDADLCNLLTEKIVPQHDTILDGFPRQLSQAQWLLMKFANRFDMVAVYLNISRELMEKRIKQRISEGVGRVDDADKAVVQRRLDSFFNKTVPALDWMKNSKQIKFLDIPIRDVSIDENYATLTQILCKNNVITR